MARYRKLPVEIEAERVFTILEYIKRDELEILPKWVQENYKNGNIMLIPNSNFSVFLVKTLEGDILATLNDYLVKGIDGELYPCKIDIFNKTYEKVVD